MTSQLLILVIIVGALLGLSVFLCVLEWRRPKVWTPFNEDGYVDHPRLEREGWHHVGAIHEDGIQ